MNFGAFKISSAKPRAPVRSVFGDEPDPAVPSDRAQPSVDELQASLGVPSCPTKLKLCPPRSTRALRPRNAVLHCARPHLQELGHAAAQAGDFSTALRRWEEALAANEDLRVGARLRESRAQALLEVGATWAALGEATRTAELDPSFAAAQLTKGRCQLNYGEPELAVASLETAARLDPGGAVATAAAEDLAAARALVAQRAGRGARGSGARVGTG